MRTPNTVCEICGKPLYRRPYELKKQKHSCCKGCRSELYKKEQCYSKKGLATGWGWNKGMSLAAGDKLSYGRPRSEETKRKISEASKGKLKVERVKRECLECGKPFEVLPCEAKRGGYCCSVLCSNRYDSKQREYPKGEDNPNYKGGYYKDCEICGTSFWVIPYKAETKRFCSKECRYLGQREYLVERNKTQRISGTDIELILEDWLKQEGIDFEAQKSVEKITIVDFFIPPNICLYADGDYWHSLEKTIQRDRWIDKHLADAGYEVIRLLGSDIKKGIRPEL